MTQMYPLPNQNSGRGPADHKLAQSIVVTLCCCQPLGIAAIVFSAMAMSANSEGSYDKAHEHAKKANMFGWIGFAIGAAVTVLYLLLMLIGSMG